MSKTEESESSAMATWCALAKHHQSFHETHCRIRFWRPPFSGEVTATTSTEKTKMCEPHFSYLYEKKQYPRERRACPSLVSWISCINPTIRYSLSSPICQQNLYYPSFTWLYAGEILFLRGIMETWLSRFLAHNLTHLSHHPGWG